MSLGLSKDILSYSQQNFHYSNFRDDILNNIENKDFENKNNYNSFIIQENKINNNQDFQIKNSNEIELYTIINKSETNSIKELLKININQHLDKKPCLSIQITNPNEPLFLYNFELSENEFQKFKEEQNLLINFQKFPEYVFELLSLCKNYKEDKYNCILNISEKGINVVSKVFLNIEEKNQYRKLIHLSLKMKPANDIYLKKYLSILTKDYKNKYETLLKQYEELSINFDNIQKENNILKENGQNLELEHKAFMNNALNEKNKEINDIREKNLNETKIQLKTLEAEKNKIINNLENKILELQKALSDEEKNKTKLEEYKLELENNKKDLEGKYAVSNIELNVNKSEISNLRYENSELNKKWLNNEKALVEYKYKIEILEKELAAKNKNLESKQQLIETLNKNRDSNEDIIKSLKAQNSILENKLKHSASEINKANEIITKLQDEIKNQKLNLKSVKNELNSKEELINQRQELLEEKNQTIKEIKQILENKEKELIDFREQIDNYTNKLKENEKLIEENKEMILYLNKNKNENNNNPFRARINYSTMDYSNNYLKKEPFIKDDDEQNENYLSKSKNQDNIISSDKANFSDSNNSNFKNYESINLEINNKDNQFNISHSSFRHLNNINNSFPDNLIDIKPSTNFTGHQFREGVGVGGYPNQDSNNIKQLMKENNFKNNSMRTSRDKSSSLLEYKYGNAPNTNRKNGNNRYKNKYNMSSSQKYIK